MRPSRELVGERQKLSAMEDAPGAFLFLVWITAANRAASKQRSRTM